MEEFSPLEGGDTVTHESGYALREGDIMLAPGRTHGKASHLCKKNICA